MDGDEIEIPFRCGRDRTEWHARLGPVGSKLGFIRFHRKGETVEPPTVDKKAKARRRLDELLKARPPLPPPPQAEVVPSHWTREITVNDITEFGFKCPSCSNGTPLACPSCKKYFCFGGAHDTEGRFLCAWCGATLELRTKSDEEHDSPPTKIETTFEGTQIRYRQLTSGKDDERRLP